jgi:hypothetical protein
VNTGFVDINSLSGQNPARLRVTNTSGLAVTFDGQDYGDALVFGGGGGGGGDVDIDAYTASHILDITNASSYVTMDVATANTLTVPPNADVAFTIGNQITVRQIGLGQTTIVEGSGVTIYTPDTLVLRKQFSTVTLVKVGTNEWDLMGDVELFAP